MTEPSSSDGPTEEQLDSILNEIEEKLKRSDLKEYETYRSLTKEKKLQYIKANWVKLATAVDRECLKMMSELIHPLLANTLTPQRIDEINKDFAPRLGKKIVLIGEYHQIMTRLVAKNPDLTRKEKIQLTLPSYLMLFEGPYIAEVDFLIHLLLKNGKAYYRTTKSGKKPRTLETYDEIENEFIRQKLLFLQGERFSDVVEAADRDLRNAIAHLDYSLADDGCLSYECSDTEALETIDYDTLDARFLKLYSMVLCINRSIKDFYEEWINEQLAGLPEDLRGHFSIHEKKKPP